MPFKVTYPDGGVLVSDQIDAELYRSLGCTIEEVAAEPATEPTPEPTVEPEPEATPEKPARRRTAKPAATEGE